MIGDVRFVTVRLHQTARPAHFDPDNLPWRVIPEIAGGGVFLDPQYLHAGLPRPLPGTGGVGQRFRRESGRALPGRGHGHRQLGPARPGCRKRACGASTATPMPITTEIVGTRPTHLFVLRRKSRCSSPPRPAWRSSTSNTRLTCSQPLIQTMVDDLNGEGYVPQRTGVSAACTTWVMEQMIT
ncbi:MAG: hypothetical protein R3A10_15620 [Caldilineaceae bacterium]